jgi:hypothetical protein
VKVALRLGGPAAKVQRTTLTLRAAKS